MKHIRILGSSLITGLCLSVVSAGNSTFTVTSPAFVQGKSIAKEHTCDGIGSSLPLRFGTPPAGTKSFAILLWDDDAPAGLASQWIVYDMPISLTGLEAGVKDGANVQGFKQGKNTFGKLGYSALCPSKGGKMHHYYVDFYAINVASLGLPAGSSLNVVHAAIKRHKILESKLMGVYAR